MTILFFGHDSIFIMSVSVVQRILYIYVGIIFITSTFAKNIPKSRSDIFDRPSWVRNWNKVDGGLDKRSVVT